MAAVKRTTARNVSLARALSKLGYSSRSQAAEAIAAGRVRVNGRIVRNPSHRCSPDSDAIAVDGKAIGKSRLVYIAMNKPTGVVTTRSDELGRRTVYDVLGDAGRWVFPVGRLDKETSGLLLLTNDTRLGERLTRPDSEVPKTYHVRLDRYVTEEDVQTIRRGMRVKNVQYRPADVARLEDAALVMTIVEGKNRQIRRIFESLGYTVVALSRVRIGRLTLSTLGPGEWRYLKESEVRALLC